MEWKCGIRSGGEGEVDSFMDVGPAQDHLASQGGGEGDWQE